MRTPAIAKVLRLEVSTSTIISACCFSLPASAPSSQSQVTSKTRPSFDCSSSALTISFSLPAKCSHAGITGKGFSPANSASLGCGAWTLEGMETPETSILGLLAARNEHRVVEIEDHRLVLLPGREVGQRGELDVLRADHAQPQRPHVVAPRDLLARHDDVAAIERVPGESRVRVACAMDRGHRERVLEPVVGGRAAQRDLPAALDDAPAAPDAARHVRAKVAALRDLT